MTARSVVVPAIAFALMLLLSCAGSDAYAGKRRAAGQTPAVPGWNHEWARGAVFYEIFVRSFADSDGDGIGDFEGLIGKLDYLNDGNPSTTTDLGVDGVWLMPVFESPSYHGYDTTDYETIERDYGTNAGFQRFLDEAHRRGIRVIIDFVANHSSSEHPWFADSASSAASAKRDWFVWNAANPGWKQPWGGNDPSWHLRNGSYYYGAFWSGMPDLNYRNLEVKAEMFRLARHWLALGVDGYRLDATRYLVETGPGESGQADTLETHQVLGELADEVKKIRPDAILVAENTTDTRRLAKYFGSMPMNFNFPLALAVVDGLKRSDSRGIRATLREMASAYPPNVIDTPFLTNHDQTRIATVLGNDAGKLRSSAAVLLTLPGTPFLYYGEEIGMDNGPTPEDESKRTPMAWTASGGFTTTAPWRPYAPNVVTDNVASQTIDSRSLLSHYRTWIAARKRSPALLKGDITPIETVTPILAFTRDSGSERVLVVHNLSSSIVATGTLPLTAIGFESVQTDPGVSTPSGGSSGWTLTMPPHSSGVWRVR